MHRLVVASFLATLLFALPSAAQGASCLVVPNPGVEVADTETVAQIVCAELRRQGEAVGEPTYDASGERWRVGVRPLGRKVFLSLQRVRGDGSIGEEGEILLSEIEEVPVAAPRLVESVRTGKPMAATASVDTLVGEETRKYRKKGGESFFGLGFMGIGVPGTDVVPGGGLILRWSFETVDFGVLGDLRVVGGSHGDDSALLFSAGVGGRWFLSESNWSPFLGLGVGWTGLNLDHAKENFKGSQLGMGGWLEFGVEALRFYESRLSLDLRAELPFFELDHETWDWEDGPKSRRKYYVPLTFAVVYSF
jgi:hypothetical protein